MPPQRQHSDSDGDRRDEDERYEVEADRLVAQRLGDAIVDDTEGEWSEQRQERRADAKRD